MRIRGLSEQSDNTHLILSKSNKRSKLNIHRITLSCWKVLRQSILSRLKAYILLHN